jgi:polysaccharide deacetylase family protein (PEP-CTERM system associated)
MKNAFTVDLEDWYCVYNLSRVIRREAWGGLEPRIERPAGRLLDRLSARGVKATFFVLGWIAERHPDLIREIAGRGHEIATHGYSHRLLTGMTPEAFHEELAKSLDVLGRVVRRGDIIGFRAPSFSLTAETSWAVDILRRHGIRYDSSVVPTSVHPDYGIGSSPLSIHSLGGGIVEVPLSCLPVLNINVPFSGGGYFRLYPYGLTRRFFRAFNRKIGPVVFYIHPWELDPGQPRIKVPASKRFRHYLNLAKTESRLERLLRDFEFASIREVFGL